jgi:hypothetical protein
MIELKCPVCQGNKHQVNENGEYRCLYCGAVFTVKLGPTTPPSPEEAGPNATSEQQADASTVQPNATMFSSQPGYGSCTIKYGGTVLLLVPYTMKIYANNQLVGMGPAQKPFEVTFPIECKRVLLKVSMFANKSAEYILNAEPGTDYTFKIDYARLLGLLTLKPMGPGVKK